MLLRTHEAIFIFGVDVIDTTPRGRANVRYDAQLWLNRPYNNSDHPLRTPAFQCESTYLAF
jgi:hypothetical protein